MGSTHAKNAGNRRGLAMVVAGIFAVSGVSLITFAAMNQQERAPEPPLSVSEVTTTPTATATPTVGPTDSSEEAAAEYAARKAGALGAPKTADPGAVTGSPTQLPDGKPSGGQEPVVPPVGSTRAMSASRPVSISIPSINVNSSGMLSLGLTAQDTLQVPPPGPDYDKVGWYKNSPSPGELGPAVLYGHVDSAAKGPSVFFRLGAMRRGDTVRVTRADSSVAVFKVDDVKRFRKADFPAKLVYGNTSNAALRLITCSGPFDRDSGSYTDNTIVLASLVT